MNNYDNPGIVLTPTGRRVRLVLIIIGLLLLIALALTDTADAADMAGNRGGCAPGNQWRGLACVVTAYTPGYVSGTCDGGLWFDRERSARTWRLDTPVRVTACEYTGDKLSGAPGYKFRISR